MGNKYFEVGSLQHWLEVSQGIWVGDIQAINTVNIMNLIFAKLKNCANKQLSFSGLYG